ncbi:hypothetical protein ACJX0J_035134 [Zea mays]
MVGIGFSYVVFRTTHWLRFWTQLQRKEDDQEQMKTACCNMEDLLLDFFIRVVWCLVYLYGGIGWMGAVFSLREGQEQDEYFFQEYNYLYEQMVYFNTPDGALERIPAWAAYIWTIYECHVGISGSEQKLIGVVEHKDYSSIGYKFHSLSSMLYTHNGFSTFTGAMEEYCNQCNILSWIILLNAQIYNNIGITTFNIFGNLHNSISDMHMYIKYNWCLIVINDETHVPLPAYYAMCVHGQLVRDTIISIQSLEAKTGGCHASLFNFMYDICVNLQVHNLTLVISAFIWFGP